MGDDKSVNVSFYEIQFHANPSLLCLLLSVTTCGSIQEFVYDRSKMICIHVIHINGEPFSFAGRCCFYHSNWLNQYSVIKVSKDRIIVIPGYLDVLKPDLQNSCTVCYK